MTDLIGKQAASLMRDLDIRDRNMMISKAGNAIDARHRFAARDFAAYQERMARVAKDAEGDEGSS